MVRPKQTDDRVDAPRTPTYAELARRIEVLNAHGAKLTAENQTLRRKLAKQHDAPMIPLKRALRAGYSYETLRHWAESGAIAAEKRGGTRWYIDEADLERHLAGVPPTSA
jgi:hypothetical protein